MIEGLTNLIQVMIVDLAEFRPSMDEVIRVLFTLVDLEDVDKFPEIARSDDLNIKVYFKVLQEIGKIAKY